MLTSARCAGACACLDTAETAVAEIVFFAALVPDGSAALVGGWAPGAVVVAAPETLLAVGAEIAALRVFHNHPAATTRPIVSDPNIIHRPRRAPSSGRGRTGRASGTASALAWRFSRSLRTWLMRL